jgi:hypothetical protein
MRGSGEGKKAQEAEIKKTRKAPKPKAPVPADSVDTNTSTSRYVPAGAEKSFFSRFAKKPKEGQAALAAAASVGAGNAGAKGEHRTTTSRYVPAGANKAFFGRFARKKRSEETEGPVVEETKEEVEEQKEEEKAEPEVEEPPAPTVSLFGSLFGTTKKADDTELAAAAEAGTAAAKAAPDSVVKAPAPSRPTTAAGIALTPAPEPEFGIGQDFMADTGDAADTAALIVNPPTGTETSGDKDADDRSESTSSSAVRARTLMTKNF